MKNLTTFPISYILYPYVVDDGDATKFIGSKIVFEKNLTTVFLLF